MLNGVTLLDPTNNIIRNQKLPQGFPTGYPAAISKDNK
jgi:hypothetical protein